jgi:hypothetical protein
MEHGSCDDQLPVRPTRRVTPTMVVSAMRWYRRPEDFHQRRQLRHTPRPASWNASDHPDQVRLNAYLDNTEALVADARVAGPWALRLDVGAPTTRNLLTEVADLDNYAFPLASRLTDSGLVSVWCTKQHDDQSFVRIQRASEVHQPQTPVLLVRTTASTSSAAYKQQIHTAIAGAAELPAGPVRLELSFVVGPRRNWLNLWKPTIDSLDPLLGRTSPDRDWHPLDGRINELGMHVTVDPTVGDDVVIGIAADQGLNRWTDPRELLRTAAEANGWDIAIDEDDAGDVYRLADQNELIQVWWGVAGVLMATACGHDGGYTNIEKSDDSWTKVDRVLGALTSRTAQFPPLPHYNESPYERLKRHTQACIDGVAFE